MPRTYTVPSFHDLLRLARKLRRERGPMSLQAAQELAAREAGFEDLFHAKRSLPARRPPGEGEGPTAQGLLDQKADELRKELLARGMPPGEAEALVESCREWDRQQIGSGPEDELEAGRLNYALYGYTDLHHWFGLSYASYQVIHPEALARAGEAVQGRFAALLEALDRAYAWRPTGGQRYEVRCKGERNRFVKDPMSKGGGATHYIVLPRILMSDMPMGWQSRMLGCLHAIQESCEGVYQSESYLVVLVDAEGRKVQDPLANYRHGHMALSAVRRSAEKAEPTCRFCGEPWTPPPGVSASRSFCRACQAERRALARERLGAHPLTEAERQRRYIYRR